MYKQPAIYILASKKNGTLYIGVTSHLQQRTYQHKNNQIEGFSSRYHTYFLVYYELHSTMESAITREKHLKRWNRQWKLRLINKHNPAWKDLYPEII